MRTGRNVFRKTVPLMLLRSFFWFARGTQKLFIIGMISLSLVFQLSHRIQKLRGAPGGIISERGGTSSEKRARAKPKPRNSLLHFTKTFPCSTPARSVRQPRL